MKTKIAIVSFLIWLILWLLFISIFFILFLLFEKYTGIIFIVFASIGGIIGLFWMAIFIKIIENFITPRFK